VFDGRLCNVTRSNEDTVHDSKVGRLVSNKNERRESSLSLEFTSIYLKERCILCVLTHTYCTLNITFS